MTTDDPIVKLKIRIDKMKEANDKIGVWLSAALDDKLVCDAMKADINYWFENSEFPEVTSMNKNQLEIKWEKQIERNKNEKS